MLPVWSIYLVSRYLESDAIFPSFGWSEFIIIVTLTLVAAGSYYLNQITDFDTDTYNRKLGFLQRGLVSEKGLTAAFLALSTLSLILAAVVSLVTLFLVAQLFLLGYCYSAKPLRLKDRAIGGIFANAYGFGLLIPLAAMPHLAVESFHRIDWTIPLYFLYTVGAIYLFTTLADREGDRMTNKKTLAVIMPRRLLIVVALLFLLRSAMIAHHAHFDWLAVISSVSSVPVLIALFVRKDSLDLLATKLPILLLTVMAGLLYPGYLVFIVAVVILTRLYYKHRFGITYPRLT